MNAMKVSEKRRKPEIRWYFPIWHHHHSGKMQVKSFDAKVEALVIEGSAASVKITPAKKEKWGWLVEWEVKHSHLEGVCGRVIMKTDRLEAAFGLSEKSSPMGGDWLLECFGGDSAEQGQYIRWQRFLNIPGPGTGHDGDPNVSIELNDSIRDAVRKLIDLKDKGLSAQRRLVV